MSLELDFFGWPYHFKIHLASLIPLKYLEFIMQYDVMAMEKILIFDETLYAATVT